MRYSLGDRVIIPISGSGGFPTSPNDGQTFFRTEYRAMFMYDLTSTSWKQTSVGEFTLTEYNTLQAGTLIDKLQAYVSTWRCMFQYNLSDTTWYQTSIGFWSGALPPSPIERLAIWRSDIRTLYQYNATNTVWRQVSIGEQNGAYSGSSALDRMAVYRSDLTNVAAYDAGIIFSGAAVANTRYIVGKGITDNTTRSNSTTTAGLTQDGKSWLPYTGTWGILGNQIYSVTNAASDLLLAETECNEPTLQYQGLGTIANATNYNLPSLYFKALDANNALIIQPFNGVLNLYKLVAGVLTGLGSASVIFIDNAFYTFTIKVQGQVIKCYVNSTLLITYTMSVAEMKIFYTPGYTKVGPFDNKGGTGGTFAPKWTNINVRQSVD